MAALLRKYGVSGIILFPAITTASGTFASGVTFAASDVRVSKNEAAQTSATAAPSHVGSGLWKWAYTASQATTKRLSIVIKDQTASRAYETVFYPIETYGNAAAQHPYIGASHVALSTGQHDTIGTRTWATTARTLTSGSIMWSAATRTLTSAAVAWTAGARTLTSGANVWTAATRTMTSGANLASSVWGRTAAELAAVPSATAAYGAQMRFLYVSARNKRITTATGDKIHTSATVVIATAPLSATTSVFTKGKYA